MDKLARPGRFLFAIAISAFSIQHFIYARTGAGLGPPWILQNHFWVYLTGFVLLVTALLLLSFKKARMASILLAMLLFLYLIVVYAPRVARSPHDPGLWTSALEIMALCGTAFVLSGATGLGRYFFAFPLIGFGVQHFLYAVFVATLVPAWIPAHLFWAYFVGVAFVAAALSIISKKMAGLAAALLGIMFFLWVLVLHTPRVIAAAHSGNEWTSLFMAMAMSGSAWLIAGTQRKPAN